MSCDSLVLLAVVSQNEILELHLYLHPLLVAERRPDVMRFGDGRLVRLQDQLRPVVVHMQRAQDQNETRERLKNETAIF